MSSYYRRPWEDPRLNKKAPPLSITGDSAFYQLDPSTKDPSPDRSSMSQPVPRTDTGQPMAPRISTFNSDDGTPVNPEQAMKSQTPAPFPSGPPQIETQDSPTAGAETKTTNASGTTFNTQPGMPGLPDLNLYDDPTYNAELQRYLAAMKQTPQKQGKLAQIGYQISQAAVNFSRGLEGQQMEPFQWLGQAKDQRNKQLATQRFAPYQAQRELAIQEQQNAYKTKALAAEANQKILEGIRANNPEFAKQLEKGINEGYVTQDMADAAKRLGFGGVVPMDNRERIYEQRGDKTFSRPKNPLPGEDWQEEGKLTDPMKTPILRELPTGEKFYTTGDKEADRIATTSLNQARLQLDQNQMTQREYDRYTGDMREWGNTIRSNVEKRGQLDTQAGSLESDAAAKRNQATNQRARAANLKDSDPKEATRLEEDADKLEAEAVKSESQVKGLRQQIKGITDPAQPTLNRSVGQAPQLTTGTRAPKIVTQSQLEQMSKQFKKSIPELKALAAKEGFTIQ